MSLRNFAQDIEYGNSLGMDTTSPLTALGEGFSRLARNANLPAFGPGYIKRAGYTNELTSSVWSHSVSSTDMAITLGIEFKTAAGSSEQIVFGTDDTAGGGELGRISGNAVTLLETGLTGDVRPAMVQFHNLLFFMSSDGTGLDPFIYDGSGTQRQIGITVPGVTPTGVASAGGSLTPGDYLAAITFYNTSTGAESTPSTFSASVTAAGSEKITWTITGHGGTSATADQIRLYRTVANANVLFFEQAVAITELNTIVSTAADSSLTFELEIDNSRIEQFTSTPKFPMVAQNRVFVVTDELAVSNPQDEKSNAIRYSKIGQTGPMPESFEVKAFAQTIGKHGSRDGIVGLAQIKDIPLVLKKRSIGRLDPVGIPDNTAVDNVIYQYKEISDSVGAVSHWAGVQVYDEYVFLGRDNVYATNSQTLRPIANQLQATIRAAGFSETANQPEQISAVNDTKNKRVYISMFTTSASTKPDLVIVGDYQQYPDFRWTVYAEGSDSSTHPGMRPGSFFQTQNTTDGGEDVFFGNRELNGKVYKMNDGTSDDTSAISFKVVSRPYSMQNPFLTKLYKDVATFATGSSGVTLRLCSIYDLSDTEEFCKDFTLPAIGGLWGDPGGDNWGDDDDSNDATETDLLVWDGEPLGQLEFQPHKRAKFQQLVYLQETNDASVSLLGWVSGASVFGRE